MSLEIKDGRFFSGRRIPIRYDAEAAFEEEMNSTDRFKLILVESGAGVITIGGRKLAFMAPMLFCFSEQDRMEMALNSNVRAQAFYFHPQFVNRLLTFEALRADHGCLHEADRADAGFFKLFLDRSDAFLGQFDMAPIIFGRISGLFDGIRHEIGEQGDKYWLCRIRSYLLELLLLLECLQTVGGSALKPPGKAAGDIEGVLLYLHTYYQSKVTIPELCTAFHINRTSLQKQFQAVTGASILAYLIKLRIRLSTLLLKNTGLPIYEIVKRLGFSDNAHFTKMFRKHFTCTPNEYRQQYFRFVK